MTAKPARKAISKRLRFDVFKRDAFACQYCGQTPPRVVLELDHITPVSLGGKDVIENLVAACFDCSRGKAGISLHTVPISFSEKARLLKDRAEQVEELQKYQREAEEVIQVAMASVTAIYEERFPDWTLTAAFKERSMRTFLGALTPFEACEAMRIACVRMQDSDRAIKYFCGICWKKIRGES